ncbi:MAG: hypothetical protein ABW220_17145 [Burkholderiaceae bacterium]
MKKTWPALIALTASTIATAAPAGAQEVGVSNRGISEPEVIAAQQAWCKALVDISTTFERSGHQAARGLAERVIDAAYAYQMGPVLFKPTLTVAPQTFRPTRAGALAYFVGGDTAFPNDKGFALSGWKRCEPANNALFIAGNSASTMGHVSFTDSSGRVTTVDKTWTFVKDDAGKLRIAVHHSSLPYTGR